MSSLCSRLLDIINRASPRSETAQGEAQAPLVLPARRFAELLSAEQALYLERPDSPAHVRLGPMPIADAFGVIPPNPTLSNPRVIAYAHGLNAIARADDGQLFQIARPGRRVPTGKLEAEGPNTRHVLPAESRGWVLLPMETLTADETARVCEAIEDSLKSIREIYAKETTQKRPSGGVRR